MKLVYSALDLIQAKLIQNELSYLGVPSKLFNEHASSGLGELPTSFPEVWIMRDQDEMKARQFITRFEVQLKQRGEESIICPHCTESNPANFELCWSCHANLN
ncbi:MAG: hypothetical protein ACI9J2_001855 [Saprospiraceae bacterium]|jgi:hypothetical protein